MKANLLLFAATFAVGAVAALVTRAVLFNPHAAKATAPAAAEYSAMVDNQPARAAAPASHGNAPAAPAKPTPAADSHAGHAVQALQDPHAGHAMQPTSKEQPAKAKPVNTRCAICGMEVDESSPTATYQGKTIGFGCKACLPKFLANPDKYGPYYLRNEIIPE